MMIATNNGVGMDLGFPDVCLTPAGPAVVPIPYPNIAMHAMTVAFSPNIYTGFLNAVHLASQQPTTMGMEPGVAHPLYKMMGLYTMGNPCIFVNCLPAIHLVCPTTGNSMNDAVGMVTVPSVTVTMYNDASASEGLAADVWATLRRGSRGVEEGACDGAQVLRIDRFDDTLRTRLFRARRGMGDEPLVLDLRGCPGGDATAALSLADDFVPVGAALAVRVEGDHRETLVARRARRHSMPLTLWVDGETASAAELFVLALRGRAACRGSRTAGKATAQRIVAGEGELSYQTVAHFEGADGTRYHGVGLEPDGPLPRDA